MSGIVAYGAYIPVYRLKREAIAAMWGSGGDIRGEKAVANYDEDSVTMGVASGIDCLTGLNPEKTDAVFFATTSPPYGEKQSATIIATALDIPEKARTADFGHSLRSGTIALNSALDAVNAGSLKNALVIASDCRLASPHSDNELVFGDGSAAVLIGNSNVVAEIEGTSSIYNEILDNWRPEFDNALRSWEERFIITKGYSETIQKLTAATLAKYGRKPGDFARVVLYGPDARNHAALAKSLGFNQEQVQEPFFTTIGNTGSASALMMLVAALEQGKPGDRILLLNYGDGADAIIFRITEEINKLPARRGIKGHLNSRVPLEEYRKYAVWRGLISEETAKRPQDPPPSVPFLWRDRRRILALMASRCKACGTVQYPPQRVCVKCQSKDEFEEYKLSDKRAKAVTYVVDYLATTVDSPAVFTWIDFEGSGRMHCEMTDHALQKPFVGMPLEMSFRKLYTAAGVNNYFWKARPIR
jgi:hydroxymethylglutaryl-CoA synthase